MLGKGKVPLFVERRAMFICFGTMDVGVVQKIDATSKNAANEHRSGSMLIL